MADKRIIDFTEAASAGADYYLVTDSASDGVKKIKPANIIPAYTGDVTSTAGGTVNTIAPNAVTNAKAAQMAAGTIKSNLTGALASASDNTINAVMDAAFGSVQGAVAYRGASGWSSLAPGTSGQFMQTSGPSANPIWQTIPGGGNMLSTNYASEYAGHEAAVRANLGLIARVADRTALKALDTTKDKVAYVMEKPYEGVFLWDGTVPIATHQADALIEGRYVAPNAAAIGAWVAQMSVESGTRWTSDNPRVNVKRIGGRLFVGASAVNNGAAGVGRTNSWFDDDTYVGMSSGGASLEQNAQAAFVTNSGLGGIVAASRTSDYPVVTGGTIAVTGWAFDDSTVNASGAWGGYFIGVRKPGGIGTVLAAEIGAWNQDADAPAINPYAMSPAKAIYAVHIANGIPAAAGAAAGSYKASSAISIINNHETDGQFQAGIVFKAEAIASISGKQTAIAFGKTHRMAWYYAGGNVGAEIRSDVDTVTGDSRQSLVFTNFGLLVNNNVGQTQFRVDMAASTVNYVGVLATATGVSPRVYASGTDVDVDLSLVPKGAGYLNLGGPALTGTAGTQAGFILLKYNGTAFKIPAYLTS